MGVIFFEKNKIDIDLDTVTITVTDAVATDDGSSYVDYLRNRKNSSGWATTDSTDAAYTEIKAEMQEMPTIDSIILVDHNFKSYRIEYYDGSTWNYFSTSIDETNNTKTTTHHSFTAVEAQIVRLTIRATMTADDDKFLSQLIITEKIGELTTEPEIAKPVMSKNRRVISTLSGKGKVIRNEGAFSFRLKQNNVASDADLTILENLHDYFDGFLVWLCGGDTSQFRNERIGWRLQDIFLMSIASEYQPQWDGGYFKHGINIDMEFIEVI